jgi:hypothetical protein
VGSSHGWPRSGLLSGEDVCGDLYYFEVGVLKLSTYILPTMYCLGGTFLCLLVSPKNMNQYMGVLLCTDSQTRRLLQCLPELPLLPHWCPSMVLGCSLEETSTGHWSAPRTRRRPTEYLHKQQLQSLKPLVCVVGVPPMSPKSSCQVLVLLLQVDDGVLLVRTMFLEILDLPVMSYILSVDQHLLLGIVPKSYSPTAAYPPSCR